MNKFNSIVFLILHLLYIWIPCRANAELIFRIESDAPGLPVEGVTLVGNNEHIYFIYKVHTSNSIESRRAYLIHEKVWGVGYDPENTQFMLEARSAYEPNVSTWSKDLATLPGVELEPHPPLWHMTPGNHVLYLLSNSTMRGQSRLLFRMDAEGGVVSSGSLDGFMFQRNLRLTVHGLIAAFHGHVLALDATSSKILATWKHPDPLEWNSDDTDKTVAGIVAMDADDKDAFVLELTESQQGDISKDGSNVTYNIVRLALKSPTQFDEHHFATLGSSFIRERIHLTRGTKESIVVTDHLIVATIINEANRWNVCEIPRTSDSVPTCVELEQTADINAWETTLALTGIPGGGYITGIPSEGGVMVGIHAAEATVHQLGIQVGTATAVRLAANEEWIFALVDAASGVGSGARHFMELHRIALPAATR